MVAGGIMYSEDQWPQRLILASQHSYYTVDGHYETSSSDSDSDEFVELFGPLIDDNSSYQCPGFCVPCSDDQPLWWLVLRWLKMMLLKIARSYHAKPLLLIIAPLMAGLAIGYFLGSTRQRESSQKSRNVSYSKSSPLLTTRIWWSLRDCVALLCFRVGVWMEIGVDADNLVNDDPLDSHHTLSSENNPARSHSSSLITVSGNNSPESLPEKEDHVRANLHSDDGMSRESGVEASAVPHHVAVIMDGNRRYGIAKYGSVSKGHWDGSSKLVEFAKWCIAEQISVLTVYAFSTENWNREPAEVASLMAIFSKYCDELRVEALKRNIRILVLSTDATRIPANVKEGLSRMTSETQHCTGLIMNICMSYGSRSEILNAVRSIAEDSVAGRISPHNVDESEFEKRLLTSHCSDPDVLIRTSGEIRISNFLMWQLAYSEMFFMDKPWPAVEKEDLLQVIRTYAKGRIRRCCISPISPHWSEVISFAKKKQITKA